MYMQGSGSLFCLIICSFLLHLTLRTALCKGGEGRGGILKIALCKGDILRIALCEGDTAIHLCK